MPPLRNLNRQPLILAAAALVIVAGVVIAVWPKEPRYGGEPLTYWLDQLPRVVLPAKGTWATVPSEVISNRVNRIVEHREWFGDVGTEPEEAVRALGPSCLPTLIQQLRVRHDLRHTFCEWLIRLGLSDRYLSPDRARGQAIFGFFLLGDEARPAMPAVVHIARTDTDPDVRSAALAVLRELSPDDFATVCKEQRRPTASAATQVR
jgi:hypothetical protein